MRLPTVTTRGPDQLGQHLALAAVTVLVVVGVVLLMRRGWRRRVGRQADLPAPPAVPERLPRDTAAAAPALYVGTVLATGWLDRVAVHGLGVRARAVVRVTAGGVLIERSARGGDLWIPRSALLGARVEDALAGKVMGPGGLLVLRWQLGPAEVDTGLRCDDQLRHVDLLAAVEELLQVNPATVTPPPAAPPPVTPPRVTPPPAPTIPEPPVTTPPHPLPLVGRADRPALLVLEDGRTFRGEAFGAVGQTVGEAVFATGMTGYQETLTDPSYHRQVVVQTAPHIGNTGVNGEDDESRRIWVAGYVVRDPSRVASSWRATGSLPEALRAQGVVGISGLDTRALTRHLRERGAMRVGISSLEADPAELLARVRQSPSMTGAELASEVSTTAPYVVPAVGETRFRVTALDLGIKRRTPWHLARQGVETTVVPARSTVDDLLATGPDGVFVSNGPGDPAAVTFAHEALRGVLARGVPVFGICMGNQVLGHALGLGTYKLGYGHRGINQPVLDRASGRVQVTSHNHGFAVDAPLDHPVETPFGRVEVSHVGLNDQVVEGLRCLDVPAFSVQYHPEAAPGPHDATGLFREFAALMGGVRA